MPKTLAFRGVTTLNAYNNKTYMVAPVIPILIKDKTGNLRILPTVTKLI